MYYQQGDILLKKVDEIKGKYKITKTKKAVLAEGETTGHMHVMTAVDTEMLVYEKDGEVFVKTDGKAEVVHQEHDVITVDPGIYKIEKVREYDHFLEESRDIVD